MMKKLIATALAAAMIFGLVSVALAAGFSDTEDHARKNDILKLVSLGIIDGYPDGTFKPENPVTRAEFAKLIVTSMGLGEAAKLMAGVPTPFSDVPATHWATGFINLAHSKDIVNGYPDGTFKPEAQVTCAEALKMILCALGYTPEVLKPVYWPVTWVAKAVETGLNKGVAISANLPAVRGDVAALLENALTIDMVVQTGFGDKVEYEVKTGVNLLKGLVGNEPVSGFLTSSPELFANDGKSITVDNVQYKLLNTADANGLLGHEVKVWYNTSKEVLFVEDLTPETAIKAADYVGAALVEVDDEELDVSAVPMFRNYVASASTSLESDDEITVIFDNDLPKYVLAFNFEGGVVSSVSTLYKSVSFTAGPTLTLKDVKTIYIGDALEIGDIEKDDVVQYIKSSDNKKAVVVVTREAFTGKFARLSSARVATIGGATYSGNIDEGLLGKDVKVYLDKDGKVFLMVAATPADATKNIAYIDSAIRVATPEGYKYYAMVLLADGTKANMELTAGVFESLTVGEDGLVEEIFEYTLDGNVIDEVSPVTLLYTATGLSEKYSIITGKDASSNEKSALVTPTTVIFNLKGDTWKKYTVATFDDLVANAGGLDAEFSISDGKAKVVVLFGGGAAAGSENYGVATGWYKTADGTVVSILSKGSVVEYVYTGTFPAAKDVVTYTVTGTKAAITVEIADPAIKDGDQRVASVDGNLLVIKAYNPETGKVVADSERYYLVNADTQYVDCIGSPVTIDGVSVGVKVQVYVAEELVNGMKLATVVKVVK